MLMPRAHCVIIEYDSGGEAQAPIWFFWFLEFLKAPYFGHLLLQNKPLKTYLYETETISVCKFCGSRIQKEHSTDGVFLLYDVGVLAEKPQMARHV